MPKVVGIKFRKSNRTYNFEAGNLKYTQNCDVIVETSRGTEIGTLVDMPFDIKEEEIVAPLKPVIRIATKKDLEQEQKLIKKREEALKISAEKIEKSNLEMKLTDCEYTFDGNKLIIYFTRRVFCSCFIHNGFHVIRNYFIGNPAKCFKCIIKKRKQYILCFGK